MFFTFFTYLLAQVKKSEKVFVQFPDAVKMPKGPQA